MTRWGELLSRDNVVIKWDGGWSTEPYRVENEKWTRVGRVMK